MKNADIIINSGVMLAFGILLVLAGQAIIESVGSQSYETVLNFSASAYFLLYAGYMLIGLSILGFFVGLLKK